tara:strand:- start:679 stop:1344 length:666 start_codon:yes stop_codon:yes gene_type:complete
MALGALGTFLLVRVGPAIIRIRPAELAKTLRRFKGSKQIKKPTDAQVDKSQTITGNLGNFNKADRKIVVAADKARPTIVQSLTGTGRGSGQTTIKGIKTGESRRNTKKFIAGTVTAGTAGYVAGKESDKDKKKTTKSKTKTYAEMVKEDKEKGKGKVLARRQPLPTSPKNKNRKEDPPKDKKKVKPVEKKVVKKKVEEKKKNGVTYSYEVIPKGKYNKGKK